MAAIGNLGEGKKDLSLRDGSLPVDWKMEVIIGEEMRRHIP